VEDDSVNVWGGVGNAAVGERYVGELEGQKGNQTLIPIWRMAPLCLMWCVWRERNAHCFEDCEIDLINLKRMMLQMMFMWRENFQFMHECSFFEFIDRCSLFSLNYGLFVYVLCTMGFAPLRLLNILYLSKKKYIYIIY
jgi:hypothetical protein